MMILFEKSSFSTKNMKICSVESFSKNCKLNILLVNRKIMFCEVYFLSVSAQNKLLACNFQTQTSIPSKYQVICTTDKPSFSWIEGIFFYPQIDRINKIIAFHGKKIFGSKNWIYCVYFQALPLELGINRWFYYSYWFLLFSEWESTYQ